jgi:hypothetical protein
MFGGVFGGGYSSDPAKENVAMQRLHKQGRNAAMVMQGALV